MRFLLVVVLLAALVGRFLPLLFRPLEGSAIRMFEQGLIPDWLSRFGMRYLLQQRLDQQAVDCGPEGSETERTCISTFIDDLKSRQIAEQTSSANEQHYEVPTEFYNLVLGQRHKYSCALYPEDTLRSQALQRLDSAEIAMLRLYAERAQIASSARLRVLDLGCGWGSVTLWFAENFPNCQFVGFSNSRTQREYILGQAKARGLTNIDVITGDINLVSSLPGGIAGFDRVISIEMFEHMKNYQKLLRKVSGFMNPGGLLFVHIFIHKRIPFHFIDSGDPSDWMARHFFTGGTMPADDTLLHFQDDVSLLKRWRVNGQQYSLTLEGWLQKMDSREVAVRAVLAETYGKENEELWWNRWRGFFLACSELFNYNNGNEWLVGHYLFQKK